MASFFFTQSGPSEIKIDIRLSFVEKLRNHYRRFAGLIYLTRTNFSVCGHSLPPLNEIQPEHKALFVLLIAREFTGRVAKFNFSLSSGFVTAAKENMGIKVVCEEQYVDQVSSEQTVGRNPGLAFSGGQDSALARLLMPQNTLSLFISRVKPLEGASTQYSSAGAMASINSFKHAIGSETLLLYSDFEYLRKPVGFAVSKEHPDLPFPTLAFLLLVSKKHRLDSIGFGVVFESFYGLGGRAYSDSSESLHFSQVRKMLKYVGLELYLPVAGLSEVAVQQALSKARKIYASSCVRDPQGGACMACAKCLRKGSYSAILKGDPWERGLVEELLNGKVGKSVFDKRPIHHENVFRYFVAKGFHLNHYPKLEHKVRMLVDEPHSWMEKFYPPSLHLVPKQWQNLHLARLKKYGIEHMSKHEQRWTRNFTETHSPRTPGQGNR